VFLNFTPEQVQNPDKIVESLEEVCFQAGNSGETYFIAMYWCLAHAYNLCSAQCRALRTKRGKTN